MSIDQEFLAMLACPACHGELLLKDDSQLVCVRCRKAYPIRDGYPVLLIEEALEETEEAKDVTPGQ